MKILSTILVFLTLASAGFGQYSRIEKTNHNPADANPLSDAVPDVYTISGDFERFVVVRMKHKADLLEGLRKAVKDEGIQNGVILAAAGSVRGYHVHVVSNGDFPSKNYFFKDPTRNADITSMNGYIVNGRVHPHITLADEMEAFGGHLEPETEVFTFAVITIGVFGDDVDLEGVDNKAIR